ncbi:N-acetylglucosamine kinase [Microbacterium sp. YY-01]|uniref:N-acetylglucosamine kinase n=1 Tax=Microbacterium sp. YY-01 TaxID=3421634 RepID=UPI003D17A8F7
MTSRAAVMAIDVGGSGIRGAFQSADARGSADVARTEYELDAAYTHTDLADTITGATTTAITLQPPATTLTAIAISSRGVASLVAQPHALAQQLAHTTGCPVTIVADAVAAHEGCLGGMPGIVSAVGTGCITLGTNTNGSLIRAGGWGPLYDDHGSGFWIGAQALSRAVRFAEEIPTPHAEPHALLHAAEARFGAVDDWPAAIYPHGDGVSRIAAFAATVAELAASGDSAAREIVDEAAEHVAAAIISCARRGAATRVALTGGVARSQVFCDAVERAVLAQAHLLSDPESVQWHRSTGTPLDGALILAHRTAQQTVTTHPGLAWSSSPTRR